MSLYPDDKTHNSEMGQRCWLRSAALERLGGDERLLDEIVRLFLAESPKLLTRMQQALLHRDGSTLELAAHCLKGQLGYLELPEAAEAQRLEDAGRNGNLNAAEELLAGFETRLARVWSILGRQSEI